MSDDHAGLDRGQIYPYIDPRNSTIFFVGKGQGNRAFSHLSDASESSKVPRIRENRDAGLEPSIEILVHSLPDEMRALHIKAFSGITPKSISQRSTTSTATRSARPTCADDGFLQLCGRLSVHCSR